MRLEPIRQDPLFPGRPAVAGRWEGLVYVSLGLVVVLATGHFLASIGQFVAGAPGVAERLRRESAMSADQSPPVCAKVEPRVLSSLSVIRFGVDATW